MFVVWPPLHLCEKHNDVFNNTSHDSTIQLMEDS